MPRRARNLVEGVRPIEPEVRGSRSSAEPMIVMGTPYIGTQPLDNRGRVGRRCNVNDLLEQADVVVRVERAKVRRENEYRGPAAVTARRQLALGGQPA